VIIVTRGVRVDSVSNAKFEMSTNDQGGPGSILAIVHFLTAKLGMCLYMHTNQIRGSQELKMSCKNPLLTRFLTSCKNDTKSH
jgi:hypothetical protein